MDYRAAMETFAHAWMAASVTRPPLPPLIHHPLMEPQAPHVQEQALSLVRPRSSSPRSSGSSSDLVSLGENRHRRRSMSPSIEGTPPEKRRRTSETGEAVSRDKEIILGCLVFGITADGSSDQLYNKPLGVPSNLPFDSLLSFALKKIGVSPALTGSAKGLLQLEHWRPLPLDQISSERSSIVGDVLGELGNVKVMTLIIHIKKQPETEWLQNIKDSLCRVLITHAGAQGWFRAADCPIDPILLRSIMEGSADIGDEARGKLEKWLQAWQIGQPPPEWIRAPPFPYRPPRGPGLYIPPMKLDSERRFRGASADPSQEINPSATRIVTPQRSRMRTSFDPEHELPRLQKWFSINDHPKREKIQEYCDELNALDVRKGRKPLEVNNIMYWFKNSRAAQKRLAESQSNAAGSPSVEGDDEGEVRVSDTEAGSSARETNNNVTAENQSIHGPSSIKQEGTDADGDADQVDDDQETQTTRSQQDPSPSGQSRPMNCSNENQSPSSSNDQPARAVSPNSAASPSYANAAEGEGVYSRNPHMDYIDPMGIHFSPNSMLGQRMHLYMNHLLPHMNLASSDEKKKRNRTFIDPTSEVPRLEHWFKQNSHPSLSLIQMYTQELNTLPYRQKFPRLEPKNVQFWFKNRRAKSKRLKMALESSPNQIKEEASGNGRYGEEFYP